MSPALGASSIPQAERDTTGAPRRRILLVSPQPFYEERGTPIAVRQVLLALGDLGYDVDLLTYPIGSTPELPGVRYVRCANPLRFESVPVGFSVRKLVLDVALVAKMAALVRRERYDAIHALEEGAFPAAVAARWLGIPLVYDMQSSLPEQLKNHRLLGTRAAQVVLRACERWLLRRADRIVASTGLAERVRAAVPGAPVREWAFHAEQRPLPTADEAGEAWRCLGVEPGTRVVLYAGTFAEYQGTNLLLDAADAVCRSRSDVVFVLVGGYPNEQVEVRRAAARMGIEGRVRVLGRLPRDRTLALVRAADILISPRAFGGNLPLKIFDYLAAGGPIVATDIPTHRTVLDERYAVLAAPEPAALAAAVQRLLDDPAYGAELRTAARSLALERFGWPRFVHTVETLYGDVFRSPSPGVPGGAEANGAAGAGRDPAAEPPIVLAPLPAAAAGAPRVSAADRSLASGTARL
jgi:glycosyltransferase involved in cell wall biosynthesis